MKLHYTDHNRLKWTYDPSIDILTSDSSWPLFLKGRKYFSASKNNSICLNINIRDVFFGNDTDFAIRCLKSRLKNLGIILVSFILHKGEKIELIFKDDADCAFFTLYFSDHF